MRSNGILTQEAYDIIIGNEYLRTKFGNLPDSATFDEARIYYDTGAIRELSFWTGDTEFLELTEEEINTAVSWITYLSAGIGVYMNTLNKRFIKFPSLVAVGAISYQVVTDGTSQGADIDTSVIFPALVESSRGISIRNNDASITATFPSLTVVGGGFSLLAISSQQVVVTSIEEFNSPAIFENSPIHSLDIPNLVSMGYLSINCYNSVNASVSSGLPGNPQRHDPRVFEEFNINTPADLRGFQIITNDGANILRQLENVTRLDYTGYAIITLQNSQSPLDGSRGLPRLDVNLPSLQYANNLRLTRLGDISSIDRDNIVLAGSPSLTFDADYLEANGLNSFKCILNPTRSSSIRTALISHAFDIALWDAAYPQGRTDCAAVLPPADIVPDTITFATSNNVLPNEPITSNEILLAGFDGSLFASIIGAPEALYSLNGGEYTMYDSDTLINVTSGDTITLRVTTPLTLNATKNVFLRVGLAIGVWNISTTANDTPIVINPVEDMSFDVMDDIYINVLDIFEDPNGHDLSYSVDKLPPSLVFDGSVIQGEFKLSDLGNYIVNIIARDVHGATAIDSFKLKVGEVIEPLPAELASISDRLDVLEEGLSLAVYQTETLQSSIANGTTQILFGDGTPVFGDLSDHVTMGADGTLTNTSDAVVLLDVRYSFISDKNTEGTDPQNLAWIRHSRFPGTGNMSGEPRFGIAQAYKEPRRDTIMAGNGFISLEVGESLSVRCYDIRNTRAAYRIGYATQLSVLKVN